MFVTFEAIWKKRAVCFGAKSHVDEDRGRDGTSSIDRALSPIVASATDKRVMPAAACNGV